MTLADLIRRPHVFFEGLRALPARPARYLGLVVLSGVLGGLATALLLHQALQTLVPAGLLYAAMIASSVVQALISWLLLWGLGQLGTGRAGRPAEVYGATFLVPLVWSLVLIVLALVTPAPALGDAPDLSTLSPLEAVQAMATRIAQAQLSSPLLRLNGQVGYAVYVVQFWLAYIGFRALQPEPGTSAMRGVMYPLGTLLVLGVASLLLLSVSGSLVGGAAGA
ncbi:hypothetical protein [Deinococcus sonorensis]|uniref:Yip1 domain-containing protein n=2 Tax=Deinococcus sonorensis TaxID=309891 RepID=A0AAU7U8B2_9DEIO